MNHEETILTVKSVLRQLDEKIGNAIESLIKSRSENPQDDGILRGKIIAYKEAKDIFKNK